MFSQLELPGAAGYFVMKIQTAKETRSDAAAK